MNTISFFDIIYIQHKITEVHLDLLNQGKKIINYKIESYLVTEVASRNSCSQRNDKIWFWSNFISDLL